MRAGPVWATLALSVALAFACAAPASAAIFSDDEARKAILDLRNRLAQSDARGEEQLRQIDALRKSLLELNTQLDLLRSDLARARGVQEQLARDVAEVQREQHKLGAAVDERVRKLEPLRVAVDGREFLADPQEKRQYEEAVARMRTGDFDAAANALGAFVRRYPGSGYFESANFWLGNALYGKRDYKEAMTAFRLTARVADHPRTPEALLAIANCLIEMKDAKAARVSLTDLVKAYPESEAAKAAKDRLSTLR